MTHPLHRISPVLEKILGVAIVEMKLHLVQFMRKCMHVARFLNTYYTKRSCTSFVSERKVRSDTRDRAIRATRCSSRMGFAECTILSMKAETETNVAERHELIVAERHEWAERYGLPRKKRFPQETEKTYRPKGGVNERAKSDLPRRTTERPE